jgi:hypothetical protein
MLDLVLSNIQLTVEKCDDPLVRCDIHHPALEINAIDLHFSKANSLHSHKNFYKADYNAINREISAYNWSIVFNECSNVNEMLDVFYSVVYELINNYVPLKKKKSHKFPHFYRNTSKKLFSLKQKKHKKDRRFYEFLRSAFKESVKRDYNDYIDQLEHNLSGNDVQPFWNHVRQSRSNKSSFPSEMYLNNRRSSNDNGNAELFADHFESVFESYNFL